MYESAPPPTKRTLSEDLTFFSSVSGYGLVELKDLIWSELSKDVDRHMTITHRPMEVKEYDYEEDEIMEYDEDDIEMEWED
mgnify:CR=1 FL=1